MAGSLKMAVLSALVGDALIAITKFGAATMTGSTAMLSKAVHSLVDTGNQGLLLYGVHPGPAEIPLTLEVDFRDNLTADQIGNTVADLEDKNRPALARAGRG